MPRHLTALPSLLLPVILVACDAGKDKYGDPDLSNPEIKLAAEIWPDLTQHLSPSEISRNTQVLQLCATNEWNEADGIRYLDELPDLGWEPVTLPNKRSFYPFRKGERELRVSFDFGYYPTQLFLHYRPPDEESTENNKQPMAATESEE